MRKTRWGVLGCAKIALTKVIPAMTASAEVEVVAVASRDRAKAQQAAAVLRIPRAYGSYEELLADPEIDCVYNPLPNHLHVPWSIKAAEASKHVLCEKPIGLSSAECRELIAARDRTGVVIGEAFMVRTHPQWLRARELVRTGAVGDLRAMMCAFSYFNRDASNVRNIPEWGGGALMDIGCYAIQTSRYIFESEPMRVAAAVERDPGFGVDRLTSGLLEFDRGHCVFTCGTQVVPYQRVHIFGTSGRIEIEIPFNAPPDRPSRIFVEQDGQPRTEELPVVDQYTIQADLFSRAAHEGSAPPTPLEDSLANMLVIEAMFSAARVR